MQAEELFRAGRLDEAIESLAAALRDEPTDTRRRTFLFELLCFAGSFDRAQKQLDVLARSGPEAAAGALLYHGALHAERARQELFAEGRAPGDEPGGVTGTLNGRPFRALHDADPRVGARLEVFAAGQYLWIPFEHVASIRIAPPRRARDLLWVPAVVRVAPSMRGVELGEVLLPVLAPFSWAHEDPQVRLGRITDWQELPDGRQVPVGQKLLVVDDNELPILELRELDVTSIPVGAP